MAGYYFTDRDWKGFATRFAINMWLSDKPCKGEDYLDDGTLLAMESPEGAILELVETGKAYANS